MTRLCTIGLLFLTSFSFGQWHKPRLECYTGVISKEFEEIATVPTTAGVRLRLDLTQNLSIISGINFSYQPLFKDGSNQGERVVKLTMRYTYARTWDKKWSFNAEIGGGYVFNTGDFKIPLFLGADYMLTETIAWTWRARIPSGIDYVFNMYDYLEAGIESGLTIFFGEDKRRKTPKFGNPFILQ